MRVTVIPVDRFIRCDNRSAHLPEWPFEDDSIHAIQWYEDHGEVELEGVPKPPNEPITDEAVVQPYVDALDAYLAEQATFTEPPAT